MALGDVILAVIEAAAIAAAAEGHFVVVDEPAAKQPLRWFALAEIGCEVNASALRTRVACQLPGTANSTVKLAFARCR